LSTVISVRERLLSCGLRKVRILNASQLTPAALTALTILIAESNPVDKEKMVSLVMALITKR